MGLLDKILNGQTLTNTKQEQQDVTLTSIDNSKATDDINQSYRSSDCRTSQMLDCCVGIQINRSNNCNKGCELCKAGAGKYPKDFNWNGWHDGCLCFITYILKEDDEFWRDLEDGKNRKSKNTVSKIPKSIKDYVSKHPECKNEDWYINNAKYFEKIN